MPSPISSKQRHKIFVSYHHDKDESYKNRFEKLFHDRHSIITSLSVKLDDINPQLKTETIRQKIRDEYLRGTTVTVVLIGAETWQRKHVDWEIASSVRDTKTNSRAGLLGIILPTYPRPRPGGGYRRHTIPPRLYQNIECGYAKIYKWSDDPAKVQLWIQRAFDRREEVNPDNSYETFANNRNGSSWS